MATFPVIVGGICSGCNNKDSFCHCMPRGVLHNMPVGLCRRHLIVSDVKRLLDELLGHFNSLFGDDESNIISLVDKDPL